MLNELVPKACFTTKVNGLASASNAQVILDATAYGYPAGFLPVVDFITLGGTATASAAGNGICKVTLAVNGSATASGVWNGYPALSTPAAGQYAFPSTTHLFSPGMPMWLPNAGASTTTGLITGVFLTTEATAAQATGWVVNATVGFHFENPSQRR